MERRNVLTYTMQAISQSKKTLQRGMIKPSQLPIMVKTQQDPATIKQVRVVPKKGFYVVEIVYEKAVTRAKVDPSFCVGMDLGVTNLAAIASTREGFAPRLVNGRPLKAWNQWYNKRMKELRKLLPKADRERVTQQMERITNTRNRRIDHYLHTASKRIIDLLVAEGIGTVIIGKNPLWKQESNMGRRGNQNFVSVPHARFIEMLTYKAELVGIQVKLTEESYTSKASFLDADPLPVYGDEDIPAFSGRRVKRGLYRAADGRHINADVNGSYNIVRKVAPDAFAQGGRGCVVHPIRLAV